MGSERKHSFAGTAPGESSSRARRSRRGRSAPALNLVEEPTPLLERPVRDDDQGPAFVGAGDEAELQLSDSVVSGANPTSSQISKSLRSSVLIVSPTELSARAR